MKKKEIIDGYEAVFDPNGEGYTVTVPKLSGLVTDGRTMKEAREMIREAIQCHLAEPTGSVKRKIGAKNKIPLHI